jgi:signal transduction histidine kinase/DNA-binding response OmpR family regulator
MSGDHSGDSACFPEPGIRARIQAIALPPRISDPEFRRQMESVVSRGLLFGGLAAIILATAFVAMHSVIGGRAVVWSYAADSSAKSIVVWDKVVLVGMGLVAILIAGWDRMARWRIPIAGILILAACSVILVDDFLQQSVHFSAAYVVLVLLVAAATMPFKMWQMLILCILAASLLPLFATVFAAGQDIAGAVRSQTIYVALSTLLLSGISGLLYRYRVEQYLGRRALEKLNTALTRQTRELEREKIKTEEQTQRLIEMETIKSQFFLNISHEFRTPLTLIFGPARDALDGAYGPLDARLRNHLDALHRNALRLKHLIDQLLDLSRIEAGHQSIDARPHDLPTFLREMHRSFVLHAEKHGILFTCQSSVEQLTVLFDAREMEKVITNLLSNAFKHTPREGRIRLSLEVHEQVEIRVRDTGEGIHPDDLPLVFDRFHRARTGLSEETPGTGIGLALARELVELHGGTIEAESEAGFGTRITITLPLSLVQQNGAVEAFGENGDHCEGTQWLDGIDATVVASAEAPLVLVVDDNADVRQYVSDHLAHRYRVVQAADGEEALATARENPPDLVISDVLMPRVDGYALCRAIRDDPQLASVPVIFLTARATEEGRIEGLEARADDYIVKPFSAAELLVRVENLIDLRRRLRPSRSQVPGLSPTPIELPSFDELFLQRVRETIESHIGDSNFGVEWLADEVALSPRQLQRRIHTTLHLSAGGLIRMMRLQRAAQLLERRCGSVAEVAGKVGFRDAVYFSRLFRQTYGVPPSEYAISPRVLIDQAV